MFWRGGAHKRIKNKEIDLNKNDTLNFLKSEKQLSISFSKKDKIDNYSNEYYFYKNLYDILS